jgi:hypothetical protein
MKISNEQHVTLHKEAQEVLEQAEKAGWDRAFIWFEEPRKLAPTHRYPYISLHHEDTTVNVETVPGYITQVVFHVAEVRWNYPIMTPSAVRQLTALIEQQPVVVKDDPEFPHGEFDNGYHWTELSIEVL